MKIYYKLLLPFHIFSLLIFLVGYIAVEIGKKALEEDIGKNTVYLADEIMEKLAGELDRSIENFEEYGRDLLLSEYLQKSNKEFERLGDAKRYIESKEKSWRGLSEKEANPLLKSLTDNPLAREIREKLKYYEEEGEKGFYEEVVVANRFGATVAESQKTAHYRHDNEAWWDRARQSGGGCACEIEYDARISMASKDEVAGLAGTFNAMAERLKEAVESRDREIAERKRGEEKILQMAYYDTLTGLPNRTLFFDRLNQVTAWRKRQTRLAAVVFLDLDSFKTINDSFGHDVGDWILTEVAGRLKKTHREYDTVARFGGDEFMLLLNGLGHRDNAVDIIKNILAVMKEPFVRDGQEFFVTCSAGISIFPDDGLDAVTLVKNADTAMYMAKDDGKSGYRFFAPEMNAAAVERIMLENKLHRALEHGEFEVWYQPQVDASTLEFVGVEALVRLRDGKGLISPSEFIPLAEQTGLIVPIGELVLRTACAQAVEWEKRGCKPIRVAVNISVRQFKDRDLVKTVSGILKETGHDPNRLDLEVTESVIMGDLEETIRALNRLRNMGIGLVIDDFGTGYSSLEHLKRLPIYMLKVAQSFVRDIINDPDDAAIAIAIIRVAHSLKLEVIAEGVETKEQYEYLDRLECDRFQGYYFSKPLASDEVFKVLIKGRASAG